jgi:mannose-6-phosphate isomerase-like protein (cupin superfamily)
VNLRKQVRIEDESSPTRTTAEAGIERIVHDTIELALIIRRTFCKEGIQFFTPNSYSQQVGYMNRPTGYVIAPHVHNPVKREVHYTKEVLFVRAGRVRVDFYSEQQEYLQSTILEAGDVILLAYGGHGFEILECAEMIEVKQGPYVGDHDKTRFEPTNN